MWQGSKTPLLAYLTVYGLFLFVIVTWYLKESYQWLASTPLTWLVRAKKWLLYLAVGLPPGSMCTRDMECGSWECQFGTCTDLRQPVANRWLCQGF